MRKLSFDEMAQVKGGEGAPVLPNPMTLWCSVGNTELSAYESVGNWDAWSYAFVYWVVEMGCIY